MLSLREARTRAKKLIENGYRVKIKQKGHVKGYTESGQWGWLARFDVVAKRD